MLSLEPLAFFSQSNKTTNTSPTNHQRVSRVGTELTLKDLCEHDHFPREPRRFSFCSQFRGIVNDYLGGQGIKPHRDREFFGEVVLGMSLLEPTVMDFKSGGEVRALLLEPRSVLILEGEARRWDQTEQ